MKLNIFTGPGEIFGIRDIILFTIYRIALIAIYLILPYFIFCSFHLICYSQKISFLTRFSLKGKNSQRRQPLSFSNLFLAFFCDPFIFLATSLSYSTDFFLFSLVCYFFRVTCPYLLKDTWTNKHFGHRFLTFFAYRLFHNILVNIIFTRFKILWIVLALLGHRRGINRSISKYHILLPFFHIRTFRQHPQCKPKHY